jgi:hypothetical protein
MVVNENANCLKRRGEFKSIASKLAPTIKHAGNTHFAIQSNTQKTN